MYTLSVIPALALQSGGLRLCRKWPGGQLQDQGRSPGPRLTRLFWKLSFGWPKPQTTRIATIFGGPFVSAMCQLSTCSICQRECRKEHGIDENEWP